MADKFTSGVVMKLIRLATNEDRQYGSMRYVAGMMGISTQSLNGIERSKRGATFEQVSKFCFVVGVPVEWFELVYRILNEREVDGKTTKINRKFHDFLEIVKRQID